MRYDDRNLRDQLACEYVLGTMPWRSRRRFERLMRADPALAQLVGAWADRLSPLDMATPAVEPPERVWRAVERRIGPQSAAPPPPSPLHWLNSLAFWRGLALAGGLATAALAIYLAVLPRPTPPTIVAVLAGRGGEPGWVAIAGPNAGEVMVSAVAPQAETKPHAYELWGIAGGPPRPLGLLPQHSGSAVTLRADELPPPRSVLAVSLEPPGGSPTRSPTGPVLYQGKVLTRAP